ncbi:MAG TPA: PepSY-associated TM helix domain-containing protein, partial [Terriglobales bacterium]|nr:PepSY-associated TM helix domain-containing protein [Terriglobales bacterium]
IASAVLAAETLLGLIVWWRLKRASINFRGSWFRICFDAHSALGIYSAIFVLLVALTGCVIGFEFVEPLIFKLTHSQPYLTQRPPKSTPGPGLVTVDQAIAIARRALPAATAVTTIQLPATPTASYVIGLRVPEETSEATHSSVWVDQYSGAVLRTQNFLTDSLGYRVIRFNRSLHTGDVWGVTGHALMGLTSLLLVIMVVTGTIIWWKKLAV